MSVEKRDEEQLDTFPAALGESVVKKLQFLDSLKAMGEEPHEIEFEVKKTARETAAMFCGWLHSRGVLGSIEIPAGMAQHFIEFVYLDIESRRGMLSKLTKNHLSEFLNLCEFAVSKEDWDAGINPFDCALSFFQFLDEIGYPARLETIARSLQALRKSIIKFPVQENISKAICEMQ